MWALMGMSRLGGQDTHKFRRGGSSFPGSTALLLEAGRDVQPSLTLWGYPTGMAVDYLSSKRYQCSLQQAAGDHELLGTMRVPSTWVILIASTLLLCSQLFPGISAMPVLLAILPMWIFSIFFFLHYVAVGCLMGP